MAINVKLSNGSTAAVTKRGQLITAPLEFSSPYSVTANVNDTAFNLVPPKNDKQFVITDILLYGDKGIGANDATVSLYTAADATETTVLEPILPVEIPKNNYVIMNGLNLITEPGRYINVKTNDNTVYAVVYGYYVDVIN